MCKQFQFLPMEKEARGFSIILAFVIMVVTYSSVCNAYEVCEYLFRRSSMHFFLDIEFDVKTIKIDRINSNGDKTSEGFWRTDRYLSYFSEITEGSEAHKFYNLKNLEGKTILDAGSGINGVFVKDLLQHTGEKPILAYGVDLFPESAPMTKNGEIVQGDLMNLPFKAESFDHIFSHYNIFLGYYSNSETRTKALVEFSRTLKPGGSVIIGPIYDYNMREIESLIRSFPEFHLKQIPILNKSKFYAELIRN